MKEEHHQGQKRFVINFDYDQAVLEYRIPEDGVVEFTRTVVSVDIHMAGQKDKVVDFTHTYVTESMRGLGIASELVR
jgi:predicted GNAT family acetyltransferase